MYIDELFESVESDVILNDYIMEGSTPPDKEKEELKKRKKELAKKIAKTLVLIAGISVIIALCKKHGDDKGAEEAKDLKLELTTRTNDIKKLVSDDSATKAEIAKAEKELEQIQVKVSTARTAAKFHNKLENEFRDNKLIEKSKKRHYNKVAKKRIRENDPFVGTKGDDIIFGRSQRASDAEIKAFNHFLAEAEEKKKKEREESIARHYEKMAKIKKAEIEKLKRNLNEAEEYILNMYKYTYIVEDVCDRFEYDQLSYEAKMDIIDTIDNRILLEDLK